MRIVVQILWVGLFLTDPHDIDVQAGKLTPIPKDIVLVDKRHGDLVTSQPSFLFFGSWYFFEDMRRIFGLQIKLMYALQFYSRATDSV